MPERNLVMAVQGKEPGELWESNRDHMLRESRQDGVESDRRLMVWEQEQVVMAD